MCAKMHFKIYPLAQMLHTKYLSQYVSSLHVYLQSVLVYVCFNLRPWNALNEFFLTLTNVLSKYSTPVFSILYN